MEEMKVFIEELKNNELTSTAINMSLTRKYLDFRMNMLNGRG